MRHISFALTTAQMRAKTKDVTRRDRWHLLAAGAQLMACEKCMGLKKGEKVVQIGVIEVVSIRDERLDLITQEDVVREGFPGWSPRQFVEFFCKHNGCPPSLVVRRIEFKHLY